MHTGENMSLLVIFIRIVIFTITLLSVHYNILAMTFTYNFSQGDQFRFLSTVNQEAGWTDEPLNHLQFINRISFSINNVDHQGTAEIAGEIHSSQQVTNTTSVLWERGQKISYKQDKLGKNNVPNGSFLPMVRDAPVFPSRDIQVGERWMHPGEEVLDLREIINFQKPYIVPFLGEYLYANAVERDGKLYHHIKLNYTWNTNIPEAITFRQKKSGENFVKNIKGQYLMDIFWDDEINQIAWYVEEYQHLFLMNDGSTYIMKGNANAHIIEAKPMNKTNISKVLGQEIKRLQLNNISIRQEEDGITLILEDIQFNPNSSYLLEIEQKKLEHLASILNNFPDRDLEITGHTAKAVSEHAAQKLSEQRALSVANFLIQQGIKTKEQIIIRGEGSKKPLFSNSTNEDMAKNRRVEIKIREN